METVSHQGRETAYEVSDRGGEGPTICFVHGSGGTREVWKSQHRLADQYPVVTLDLSGHGDSDDIDASAGYMTLSAYADDVIAVATETDASVLVGNSLGGAVVMHILLERGDEYRPDAVVLTGTGARLGVLEDLRNWLENDFERAVEFLHGPDRLFHDAKSELAAYSSDQMRACGQAVTQRDFETCHAFDVRDELSGIDVPTLVVYGEHDKLTPPRYHEFLVDEIDGARSVALEDAAHMVMLEQPAAFNESVSEFVASTTE
ncbi:alpha/beta fold family hydrolase [Natrialba chahannaoensis JCM 10990]|uniref:Alpha/beta fold family hydrolase n=1 Tax=Natrialba chahannaoensis JCM 10990 TaxID=1227492 RepID=M0AV09_9EURY|nr:alpha/beta hydrolase [Natrialba chahannaoensis]ELZ01214.1 alpha/beta fold family hydrolase [Natrialba chahannaoensis JCM 10990]